MANLTRRELLKAAEVAAAGGLLAGCRTREDPFALRRPDLPGTSGQHRGDEKWTPSVCGQCTAACGIRVHTLEGRVVGIEGNPEFAPTQGGIGPKGLSGAEILYHPNRVRGPLRRDGARGSGHWQKITWAEAIDAVGKALRELRQQNDPRALVVVDGDPRGLMSDLWERFLGAYGSPNHVDHRSATDAGKALASFYMQGTYELPAYDWEHTRYVLGLGTNLFESWCQTIHLTRAMSRLRHGVAGQRVKFVQVAPRFSATAGKADEWVPIEPATYGALALGLAHVLVRDKLHDEAFVRDHCFGFEDWKDKDGVAHRGFRDLVAKEYPPDKVAETTGVPAATIERLAHELAAYPPAVVIADGSAAAATNGLGTAMAIHALNAVLGTVERSGGMLTQQRLPLAPWKDLVQDALAQAQAQAPRLDGAATALYPLADGCVQALPQAILSGRPYPAKALFLYKSNPAFAKPGGRQWVEALGKVPLVVSFSPLADESTFWADYVLPDHTYLERWEVVEPAPAIGIPVVGLRQPVVKNVHDTRATGDVLIELARAVGGSVAEALPWKDFRAAADERLAGLAGVKDASFEAADAGAVVDGLTSKGTWSRRDYPFESWGNAFKTPSGRFEFYSQTIASRLAAAFKPKGELEAALVARGVKTRGDELCLPHFEPPRFAGDEKDMPFLLLPYRGISYAEGGIRHVPWLVELPVNDGNPWPERIDMNPDDAADLGLADGAPAWVETVAGKRKLHVRLRPGTRPGTLNLPLGYGAWPPSPTDPEPTGGYGLLANASDPLAGILALQGTRAKIWRAS